MAHAPAAHAHGSGARTRDRPVRDAGGRAHEKRSAGKFTLNFGWGDEPAFTGSRNSIVVSVADATGAAVPDLGGGSLSVEVTLAINASCCRTPPVRARDHVVRPPANAASTGPTTALRFR